MNFTVFRIISPPGGDISNEPRSDREQSLALFFIGVYVVASLVYGFMAGAPWDDDCVTRYYNTKKALGDPSMFFSLWNRPLFVLMFFPVAQIGPIAMMLQMIAITAIAGYFLFKAVLEMNINYSSIVLPLFFFQTYFFSVSRNNLTEPLAVAIICIGFYFLVKERYMWFAVAGSLLPLARLELSVLLGIWGLILVMKKQWRYIWILGVPTLMVSMLGSFYKDGGIMWMINETFGRESEENRYGHTDFWSYFKRYIFVTGPVVFYFFFIGFFERVSRRKIDLFIFLQFVLGFMLYVVFSWKLNMGNAAGFLRNLIPLTPLVAVIALYGFNYWVNAFKPSVIESNGDEEEMVVDEVVPQEAGRQKKKSRRQQKNEESIKKKQEERQALLLKKAKKKRSLGSLKIHIISIIAILITYFFYSTSIKMHHKLTGETDYTNLIIVASLSLVLLLLTVIGKLLANKTWVAYMLAIVVLLSTSSYTLITEPPDAHLSPEREVLSELSELYKNSYLNDIASVYVNHLWFFWSSGINYPSEKYKTLDEANLKAAPTGSLVIWESHYSHRIFGDVQMEYFDNNPNYVELCRIISLDNKFTAILLQKVDGIEDKQAIVDQFVETFPDFPFGYFSRSKFYQLNKQYDKSLADIDRVIELDSSFIHAYFSQGLVYHAMHDYEKAVTSFKKIADALPDYYQVNYNTGITMMALQKYKEAIPYLKRVVETKKDYWSGYEQLGKSYFNTGDYAKAIESYNSIATGQPDNALNYFNRGNCLYNQKRFQEAIADYDRCIKLQPKHALSYFNKALALGYMDKKKEACAVVLKAAQLGHAQAAAVFNNSCR